jgi:hypothetical protein
VLLAAKFIGEIAGIDRFNPRRPARASPAARRSPSSADEQTATASTTIRSLKRHLVRRVYDLLDNPRTVPTTICLT